jgi:hypothetical protein
MLACDYAHKQAKKKGVGLHYSHFEKIQPTAPTTCESNTQKNHPFSVRIAETGLGHKGKWPIGLQTALGKSCD